MVRVCPWAPKMTSWCATSPGSRTRGPGSLHVAAAILPSPLGLTSPSGGGDPAGGSRGGPGWRVGLAVVELDDLHRGEPGGILGQPLAHHRAHGEVRARLTPTSGTSPSQPRISWAAGPIPVVPATAWIPLHAEPEVVHHGVGVVQSTATSTPASTRARGSAVPSRSTPETPVTIWRERPSSEGSTAATRSRSDRRPHPPGEAAHAASPRPGRRRRCQLAPTPSNSPSSNGPISCQAGTVQHVLGETPRHSSAVTESIRSITSSSVRISPCQLRLPQPAHPAAGLHGASMVEPLRCLAGRSSSWSVTPSEQPPRARRSR